MTHPCRAPAAARRWLRLLVVSLSVVTLTSCRSTARATVTATQHTAAETECRALLAAFFGPGGSARPATHYDSRMMKAWGKHQTIGALNPGLTYTTRVLHSSAARQVHAVRVTVERGSEDYYVYLAKDAHAGWRLSAVRRFAPHALAHKDTRTPKEEHTYQSLLLITTADAELKKYMKDHLPTFERLLSAHRQNRRQDVTALCEQLHLCGIATDDGRIDFVIGGVLDHAVGFLYVPPGHKPPALSASDYIYVENAVGRWYVYRRI